MSDFKGIFDLFTHMEKAGRDDLFEDASSLPLKDRKALSKNLFDSSAAIFKTTLHDRLQLAYEDIQDSFENIFFTKFEEASREFSKKQGKLEGIIGFLREINLLKDVSDFDLFNLAKVSKEIELVKGTPFVEQHKAVDGVYLVKDKVDIFVEKSQKPIDSRTGIFGEDTCLTGVEMSTITAVPTKDSKALYIDQKDFELLLPQVPGLQSKVFSLILERASEKLYIAKMESDHAKEQYRLTQEILDNIGQGSFSIDHTGEIGENYTPIAAEYLNRKYLAGVPFADLILRNDRKALRDYYRALNLMFSGNDIDPEVILSLLPKQVVLNERTFKLHYSFVEDRDGYVMSVFVRMEEITQQLRKQKLFEEQKKKEEQEKIVLDKMRQNVGGFMDLLEEVEKSLEETAEFMEHFIEAKVQPDTDSISHLMRSLHTSKGISAQFELIELRDTLHDLEDSVQEIERDGIEALADRFEDNYHKLALEFESANLLKESLGQKIIEVLQGVNFSQAEYKEMTQCVVEGRTDELKKKILQKSQVPAQSIVDNWEKDIKRLAGNLGKKVEFRFEAEEGLFIPKKMAETLNKELGHLYRNCVDHGIEDPEKRSESGKDEAGLIHVSVNGTEKEMNLVVRDDGQGLDYEKIARLASEKPNLDQEQVNQFIKDGQVWKILFLPGFSSAENITHISGRGVGMDAVRNALEQLEGSIEVRSELGKGCEFHIQAPLKVL